MRLFLSSLINRWSAVSHNTAFNFCLMDGLENIFLVRKALADILHSTATYNPLGRMFIDVAYAILFIYFGPFSMSKKMAGCLSAFWVFNAVVLVLHGIIPIPSFLVYFSCTLTELIDGTICTSVCPTFGGSDPGIRAEFVHSLKQELNVMCGFSCSRHPSAFTALSVSPPALLMYNKLLVIEVYCELQTEASNGAVAAWAIQMEWPGRQFGTSNHLGNTP